VKRPHPERVEDYLGHIAEAITRIAGYVQPFPDIEAFRKNLQVQDAVVRNIEIIDEAVRYIDRMAPGFTGQHPEVPWAQMRGMRNIVIHQYFHVDLKVLWTTATDDLPKLKRQIDQLLQHRHAAPSRPLFE
jgi:uncharacterized protein with HEPN domain